MNTYDETSRVKWKATVDFDLVPPKAIWNISASLAVLQVNTLRWTFVIESNEEP